MRVPLPLRNYLIDWPLPGDGDRKRFLETTHRTCTPEKTLGKIGPLKEAAGITRVADLTRIDGVGIPTFAAMRPGADLYDENITVSNGKGLTPLQAKVSALMEAFERDGGERHDRPMMIGTLEEMKHYGSVIDPRDLILPKGVSFTLTDCLEWVVGTDLISGEVRWVPAAAVFFPYRPKGGARYFEGFSDTNGLASGNTLLEALSHALAEVIERDAATRALKGSVGAMIDLATLENPLIQNLLDRFKQAKMNVYLRHISPENGIPTFLAAADEPSTENPLLLCGGIGTHVHAEIAVMRALTEVAQSRLTFISGAREDLVLDAYKKEWDYHELKRALVYWYDEATPRKDFRKITIRHYATIREDVQAMLDGLREDHLSEVITVNLTRPEIGVPVVRVIVPGLEPFWESTRAGESTTPRPSDAFYQ